VELAIGYANCDTPSTKALPVATTACEFVIVLVPTGGNKTSTVVGNNSLFIAKPDADLIFVLAAIMLSEGVASKASGPSAIVSKLDKVFYLLHH
jgi:hypothetical protein